MNDPETPDTNPEMPRSGDIGFGYFILVTVQLGLLVAIIQQFKIGEITGFVMIAPLVFAGFVIHAWLPRSLRLPFFFLLTLAGIFLLLDITSGILLVSLGLLLIGICHLPVAFMTRIMLLLFAGACLAVLRGWVHTPWSSLIMPILASMFMFRLILYMHNLRYEDSPASLWQRLCYFFMLPNVCFLFFPVIDYNTYLRTYYDDRPYLIYQKGIHWILRGITHLLLYRLVYYYLLPAPENVQDLGSVVLFMVSTYLLYLQISGLFHLIIGVLCLFGFNLPQTNHLYFLANGFNDYWRRINIYWKDFMMKMFYYPIYFRLQKWGKTSAIIMTIPLVFICTWMLHSYQWFWLHGTFPVTATDGIFWGLLGVLVAVNAWFETRRRKKRRLTGPAWSLTTALLQSMRILGMFLFMCVLWSFWGSTSFNDWITLVSAAGNSPVMDYLFFLLLLLLVVILGVITQYLASRSRPTSSKTKYGFASSAVPSSVLALLLLLVGIPEVGTALGPEAAEVVASVRNNRLNKQDAERLEMGYYEGLLAPSSFTSVLWTVQSKTPDDWVNTRESDVTADTNDILLYELVPSHEAMFKRAKLQTNSWGMRDKEYDHAKPAGTYRIALLGASYSMGEGVENNQAFEALLEEKLNQDHYGRDNTAYEILNFSVGGYTLPQRVALCNQKVLDFSPDAIFFISNTSEIKWARNHLIKLIQGDLDITLPYLVSIKEKAGIEHGMSWTEMNKRLQPFDEDTIRDGYKAIVSCARNHGALPVWIFLPKTEEEQPEDETKITQMAEEAGFITITLTGSFSSHDPDLIQLAPWDKHPNAWGHKLIADKLYEQMGAHNLLRPGAGDG
jgi:D-alanyl-lipoteichoic acid acyltransferase DltB (MBOAT superfamily)